MPGSWRPLDRHDRVVGYTALVAFVVALTAAAIATARWPVPAILTMAALLAVLIAWHARSTAYRCETCGAVFEQTWRQDLVSPHTVRRQRTRCPRCEAVAWREPGRRTT